MVKRDNILAPSILAADFTRLGEQINEAVTAGAPWIHCDIMDGHFVPNISFGPMIVEAANRATDAFLDVHLMIYNPDHYIEDFVKAGADQITVHCEATPHIHRSIQKIKEAGLKAGVAINPGTPISQIEPVLPYVDLVIAMSVNPGFGGQTFIPATHKRLHKLAEMRAAGNHNYRIEVDGGVDPGNISDIARSGADVLVAGSSVFKADSISERVAELNGLISE